MSYLNSIKAQSAVDMPDGLLSWARTQGPESWHDIARFCDLSDMRMGIDPLLAAFWITQQESCDRATALLFLAKAVTAGFLDQPPAHHDERACVAFCHWLHARLLEEAFPEAAFFLTAAEASLVRRHLGPNARLPLPKSIRAVGATSAGLPVLSGLSAMTAPSFTSHGSVQAA